MIEKSQLSVEEITPEIAKQMLAKNEQNRPTTRANIANLVSAMKYGNFESTGDAIKFSKSGRLLDGQHRLLAIIEADVTVEFVVIRGLEEEAFKYMDIGRNRQASDILAMEGIHNAKKIAGMSRFILLWRNGQISGAVEGKSRAKTGTGSITNAAISDFVSQNIDELTKSWPYGFNSKNKLVNPTTLGALHFIFNKIDENMADDFCHKLSEGANLKKDSPIHVLRTKLLNDYRATNKMPKLHKLALIIKAWNLYRQNKSISILKWSTDEPFPKPL